MSIFSNGSNIFSKGNRAQEREVFTATDCRSHVYTNLDCLIQGQMQDNKGSHSKNIQIFRHYGTLWDHASIEMISVIIPMTLHRYFSFQHCSCSSFRRYMFSRM